MWSFLVDNVFGSGTSNNSNNTSPPSTYHSGRNRTPPSSSLNAQSCRSTNNASTLSVQLPKRGNFEINIKKTESRITQNCKSGIKTGGTVMGNANLGGQNYNKSKVQGSQNNGKPLNTNTNQKTNSSNSQTCNKTKFAPKNKQPNLDVRRKTEKRNN